MWFNKWENHPLMKLKYPCHPQSHSHILAICLGTHSAERTLHTRQWEKERERERMQEMKRKWSANYFHKCLVYILIPLHSDLVLVRACVCDWPMHNDFIRPKCNVAKMSKVLTVRLNDYERNIGIFALNWNVKVVSMLLFVHFNHAYLSCENLNKWHFNMCPDKFTLETFWVFPFYRVPNEFPNLLKRVC